MKQIIILCMLSLQAWGLRAQAVVEQPTERHATSFVIVTDNTTYAKTRTSLLHYRDAVQQDGLSTYILRSDWKNPDEVRQEIARLKAQCPTLEGMVLVGDVPVVLVRNAQHLTTAFKMNEETFPFDESSVPSDRFYDDLHLQFDFIKQDSVHRDHFYYKLSEKGPQTLRPTLYSARIRYPQARGGDNYEAIARFLDKAAEAKQQRNNPLDRVVSFNGCSYNSDCLVAWMDEEKAYRENFPEAFRTGTGFKHWNYRMHQPMKYYLLEELQQKDIDVFMFHEHGIPTAQLINEEPQGTSFETRARLMKQTLYAALRKAVKKGLRKDSLKQAYTAKYHLTDAFWNGLDDEAFRREDSLASADCYITTADLKPMQTYPRFVMLDACYNGSFHADDYMAGYYLFNEGGTLVVQGNTRNVLQDRWTIEMVGLLAQGVRVGHYNRLISTLEGHLMGDPTVRFTPQHEGDLSADLTLHSRDKAYWQQLLAQQQAPDVQCLAMRMLADLDEAKAESPLFRRLYEETPYNIVRMEAVKLLSRYNNDDFRQVVQSGIRDAYELVARKSADYAGEIGDSSLLPALIYALIEENERTRVQYVLSTVLPLFPREAVEQAVKDFYRTANRVDAAEEERTVLQGLSEHFARVDEVNATLSSGKASVPQRIAAVRMLRNNPYHPYVDRYLQVLEASATPEAVRIAMAEALGWFVHSTQREKIRNACRRVLQQPGIPQALHNELIQTLNRL